MDELIRVIAQSLVDDPDQVEVTKTETDEIITLSLSVASDDMGKVIGKQGRIAKAIRTIVKSAFAKEEKKIMVEIID